MAIKIRLSDIDLEIVKDRFSDKQRLNAFDLILSLFFPDMKAEPVDERVSDWWFRTAKMLKSDRANYEKSCQANRENVIKRWTKNKSDSIRPYTTVCDRIRTDEDIDVDKDDISKNTKKPAKAKKKFTPPTLEECKAYAVELGMPETEGENFWNWYENRESEALKWTLPTGQKMGNWKLAMVTRRNGWVARGGVLKVPKKSIKPEDARAKAIKMLSNPDYFLKAYAQQFEVSPDNMPDTLGTIDKDKQEQLIAKVQKLVECGRI